MRFVSPFLLSFFIAIAGLIVGGVDSAYTLEARADYAYVLDTDTNVVLLAKNPKTPMNPASMSKIMTLLMVFEAIEDGVLALDQKLRVSDNAWRKGGAPSGSSTMFLEPRSLVKVSDLIRGVIIQSGNDACIVLAEAIGGTEEEFAYQMTQRARELGLIDSSFTNATGIAAEGHKMSAQDLARLTQIIITKYQQYYALFSERSFTWNGIKQANRNPLLYANIGADGLKTGHTQNSGYGLVASAVQNGRRIIIVINGLATKRLRSNEGRRLANWAFRSFDSLILARNGDEILEVPVWHGTAPRVRLTVAKPFKIITSRGRRSQPTITVTYNTPARTPIVAGQELATLRVTVRGLPPQETRLVAANDVARAGLFDRALASLSYLIFDGY